MRARDAPSPRMLAQPCDPSSTTSVAGFSATKQPLVAMRQALAPVTGVQFVVIKLCESAAWQFLVRISCSACRVTCCKLWLCVRLGTLRSVSGPYRAETHSPDPQCPGPSRLRILAGKARADAAQAKQMCLNGIFSAHQRKSGSASSGAPYFTCTRLNGSTFRIVEDDSFGEAPFIYVKVNLSTIVVIDTGCGPDAAADPKTPLTSLREFIERCPIPENGSVPLSPEGAKPYSVMCTHCHYDHIGACGLLRADFMHANAAAT